MANSIETTKTTVEAVFQSKAIPLHLPSQSHGFEIEQLLDIVDAVFLNEDQRRYCSVNDFVKQYGKQKINDVVTDAY